MRKERLRDLQEISTVTVAARLCISMETVGTGGFILHAAEL